MHTFPWAETANGFSSRVVLTVENVASGAYIKQTAQSQGQNVDNKVKQDEDTDEAKAKEDTDIAKAKEDTDTPKQIKKNKNK